MSHKKRQTTKTDPPAVVAAPPVPEPAPAPTPVRKTETLSNKDNASYFKALYDAFHADPNATLGELMTQALQPAEKLKTCALLHLKLRTGYGGYDDWILVRGDVYDDLKKIIKENPDKEIFSLGDIAGKHTDVRASCTDLIEERIDGRKHWITIVERYCGLKAANIPIDDELGNYGTIHQAITKYTIAKEDEEEEQHAKKKKGRLDVLP